MSPFRVASRTFSGDFSTRTVSYLLQVKCVYVSVRAILSGWGKSVGRQSCHSWRGWNIKNCGERSQKPLYVSLMQANQTLLLFKLTWFECSVTCYQKKKKNPRVSTGRNYAFNCNNHLCLYCIIRAQRVVLLNILDSVDFKPLVIDLETWFPLPFL